MQPRKRASERTQILSGARCIITVIFIEQLHLLNSNALQFESQFYVLFRAPDVSVGNWMFILPREINWTEESTAFANWKLINGILSTINYKWIVSVRGKRVCVRTCKQVKPN